MSTSSPAAVGRTSISRSERAGGRVLLHALARAAVAMLPLAAGLAAWGYSLTRVKLISVGVYGLLSAVDGWYFVGLALVVLGLVGELIRARPRTWVMAAHLIGLIAVIHASVPLLEHTPEYAWVYKHIGVAAALGANGRVTQPDNIYESWPALFAGVAGIVAQSGVSGLDLARWAPPAFELLDSLLLLAIFRLITRSTRTAFLAATIFVGVVAWVGQDYLSPQAFAFAMWLGVVLVVVRWLLAAPESISRRGRPGRARAWLLHGYEAPAPSSPHARRVAVVVVAVVFFALVAAHQLTPYMALVALGALALLDLLRPRWLIVALAAIALGFLAPRYNVISSQYGGLFSGFNLVHNASTVFTHASKAEKLTATAVHYLSAATWLLAGLGLLSFWKVRGRHAVVAVLAFSPFVILFGQSYGGEAIYRVFLFSSPWCALLIATRIEQLRLPALRRSLAVVLPAAAILLGVQGSYGPVAVDTYTADELNASVWLYAHAPRGSYLLPAATNFPLGETANNYGFPIYLLPSDPLNGKNTVNAARERAVVRWAAHFRARNAFLIVSRSMVPYSRFFLYPVGFGALERNVARDHHAWRVYYANHDVTIYRLIAQAKRSPRAHVARAGPTARDRAASLGG
jgi:hypothetical protein